MKQFLLKTIPAIIIGLFIIRGAVFSATVIQVFQGGTGASSLSDGFLLLGSGTGAITPLDITAKGSILAGDGTTDPVALSVGTNDQILTADSAQASGLKWAAVGSGGDNVTVNSSAIDTTANFLDGDIDWTLTDGGAGGPDDITGTVACSGCIDATDIGDNVIDFADILFTNTLAGNPALAVDECFLVAIATGGGFICEGSTANTNEQLYLFPDVDGADTTFRIVVDATQVTDIEGTGLSIGSGTLNWSASGITGHDTFTDFVVAEHVDWAGAGAGTIHTDNYIENPFGASIDTGEITDATIAEVDLKAVNAAVDEDILTFESTTGDFEWHTPAELITAGTNITWSGTTLNVDDAFLVNNASDVMAGTLTADGLTLGVNENITLGAQTLDHDGTDFVFNDSISVAGILISADRINDFANSAGLADADSTTVQSDSGLEVVSNSLTLIRGCADNEILKWDETQDDWNCEVDADSGGSTAYDAIGDPTGAGLITFADTETATYDTGSDGETFFTISLNDVDLAADTIALLITAVDDDDVNYIPFEIRDDQDVANDLLFQIDSTGTISTRSVGTASMADVDFGDWTCSAGTCTIDALAIGAGDYAAASIDGDDINSNIAGRSLTLTAAAPDTLDADVEL